VIDVRTGQEVRAPSFAETNDCWESAGARKELAISGIETHMDSSRFASVIVLLPVFLVSPYARETRFC
jgi:hypothetical protein